MAIHVRDTKLKTLVLPRRHKRCEATSISEVYQLDVGAEQYARRLCRRQAVLIANEIPKRP
jgi:hypothetical protein